MKTLFALLVCLVASATLGAQAIPGVRMTLTAPAIAAPDGDISLLLQIVLERDAELPSQLLNGMHLTVRVDGEQRSPIERAGKGAPIALAKGTRIERTIQLPVKSIIGDRTLEEVVLVAVGWHEMIGVDCAFKIAPDTKNVALAELDLSKTQVVLVTNYGDMRLSFRPDKAPKHVESFVKLCLQGFYDGTKFHRVMRNFMVQGGCPYTKDEDKREMWGQGGPGFKLKAEFNDLRHLRGTLAMARVSSDPDSAGSGFFVVHQDSPHLDRQYTAFGNVEEGIDTLDRIANVQVGGQQSTTPVRPVVLQSAIVLPKKK